MNITYGQKVIAAIFTGGGLIGVAGGYFAAKKKYQKIYEVEAAALADRYRLRSKEGLTPQDFTAARAIIVDPELKQLEEEAAARARLQVALERNGGQNAPEVPAEPAPSEENQPVGIIVNAFELDREPDLTQEDRDAAWEVLTRDRDFTTPYIISQEEFANEHNEDHDKLRIEYYPEDDVLTDENGGLIPQGVYEDMVGRANLMRFGIESGSPNIVYVRHELSARDYEIVNVEGSYSRDHMQVEDAEEFERIRANRGFTHLDN